MKRPDIRVVLGRGGSGKSYLVKHWLARNVGRVVIFDAAAEDDYARGAVVVERPDRLVDLLLAGERRLCWRGLFEGAFEAVNRLAWAAGDLTLVWEEVDQFGDAGRLPEWAFKIVNQGRHRDIRVIACSRRPARVSRDLTANASRIVAFGTTEPRDLIYLRHYMGEAAEGLRGLDPYHALDWTEAGGAVARKSPFA